MTTLNNRIRLGYLCQIILLLCLALPLLSGCVVREYGRTIGHSIKGDYYLQTNNYENGLEHFRNEVAQHPTSALARYYYGRFLLQTGDTGAALIQLQTAAALAPEQADYHFWAGLANGENGNAKEEEKRYQTALRLDPNHLQALLYLGHSRFAGKYYQEALQLYAKALEIRPASRSALYNRGLILNKLGRTAEEKQAWLAYLVRYPAGAKARQATEHLNALGDFSYRNHHLGARIVTIEDIRFHAFTAQLHPSSNDSLRVIGAIAENRHTETLQIVTYLKNNKELARRRAVAVKRFLLEEYPGIPPERIGISWFGVPQELVVQKKKQSIDESTDFFMIRAGR